MRALLWAGLALATHPGHPGLDPLSPERRKLAFDDYLARAKDRAYEEQRYNERALVREGQMQGGLRPRWGEARGSARGEARAPRPRAPREAEEGGGAPGGEGAGGGAPPESGAADGGVQNPGRPGDSGPGPGGVAPGGPAEGQRGG